MVAYCPSNISYISDVLLVAYRRSNISCISGICWLLIVQATSSVSQGFCWLLIVPATSRVSQGRICSDHFTCCHTETVAGQTDCPTQSRCTDTGPTRHITGPITPGVWHSKHECTIAVSGVTQSGSGGGGEWDANLSSSALLVVGGFVGGLLGGLLNVPATCQCISGTDLLRQFVRAATPREKLRAKLAISPSLNTPTPGQPVPSLTL